MELTHNDHLSRYPEREGTYENIIVGSFTSVYPKLFILNGHDIISWKDGINADD